MSGFESKAIHSKYNLWAVGRTFELNVLFREILLRIFQFSLEKESAIKLPSIQLYAFYLILV